MISRRTHFIFLDAIMLDTEGFVAETNATNLFLVRCDSVQCQNHRAGVGAKSYECKAKLVTPTADACLPGITRETVLLLAKELGIETEVRRVSLSEFYCAEEVFTTGTSKCFGIDELLLSS
jgi:branched-subunit amino acid aminotransferase/4-amino-4-deoxychorismate lyase